MVTSRKMPQHVADQRAAVAAGNKNKQLTRPNEVSEHYDVFRRIDMHMGDKQVCWEWKGAHGLGTRGEYRPRVCIDQKHYYVYRVVYQLYTGYQLQKGDVVRHTCDHSWCCNPYHMIIGTQADNVKDMLDRERVGMKHYQVKRIMQMLEIGCTAKFVAAKMREGYNFVVDVSVIKKIRLRTIYKHIPWPWGDAYVEVLKRRKAELASVSKPAILTNTNNPSDGDDEDGEDKDTIE